MDKTLVTTVSTVGKAVNVVAGHVGEMTGAAIGAASQAVGCPVGTTVGKAVQAAGKAWSDTAVRVANRDNVRMTKGA